MPTGLFHAFSLLRENARKSPVDMRWTHASGAPPEGWRAFGG